MQFGTCGLRAHAKLFTSGVPDDAPGMEKYGDGPMFAVHYDQPANRVRMSVQGHFTPDDVQRLSDAVTAAVAEAKQHGDDFDVLVESPAFPVQAQDVAALLAGIMERGMPLTTGRAAVVVGSHLSLMQARRTLLHPRLQAFLSPGEAQAWLAGSNPDMPMPQGT